MFNYMNLIGKNAKKAFLKKIDTNTKNKVLRKYTLLIKKQRKLILKENAKDIKFAIKNKINSSLIDRLILNSKKINLIIKSIEKIIKLKDPENIVLEKWKRPNGLLIKRVSIPIGIIGIIYESRPNVTSDVASLCFKSGNVVILKGGSEAINTNNILAKLFRKALKDCNVDENFVQFINSKNRKLVRSITRFANTVKLDAQGRIQITPNLKEYANLEKEVTIIGVVNKIVIWNPIHLSKMEDVTPDDFDELEDKVIL